MAITNTTLASPTYNGNGITTAFATGFYFIDQTHLEVVVTSSSGAETVKILTTHYTVSGAGVSGGGTVTFLAAPANGEKVNIRSKIPLTQATDYLEGGSFSAATHEDALDKLTKISQEIKEITDRSLKVPIANQNYSTQLSDLTAGYLLRVNTTADGFEAASPTDAALSSTLTPTDGGFIVGNGTDFVVETGATARSSIGVGSIATQSSAAVSITGGTITGITDLTVADGGTGASTAADARTNLGLVIGTDVQAQDAELAAIAGLTSAANKLPYFTGSGTAALADFTAAGRALVDDADVAAQRATLGLSSSDNPQFATIELGAASDTTLARSSAGNVSIEGNIVYRAGGTDVPVTDGGTGASDASTARTNLGLAIGTDVQAYDTTLTSLASYNTNGILTQTAADTFTGRTITGTANQITVTNGDGVSGNPTLTIPYNLNLGSSSAGPSSLTFFEDTDNGSNKITMQAPSSLAGDYTMTLPTALPGSTEFLTITSGGVLATSAGTGGTTPGGSNTQVQFNNAGSFGGDSGFVYTGSGAAQLTASLIVGGNSTAAGYVELREDTDNGSNYIRITAPSAVTSNTTLTLPDGAGSSNQVLTTNGSGALSWSTPASATAASQAEQETGSSTTVFVTPGRQQFHPSAAKAWGVYNEITTTTLGAGYNVSSLTDNGTGQTTINLTTAFSSGNYCVVFFSDINIAGATNNINWNMGNRNTTSIGLYTNDSAGSFQDHEYVAFVAYGDQ